MLTKLEPIIIDYYKFFRFASFADKKEHKKNFVIPYTKYSVYIPH